MMTWRPVSMTSPLPEQDKIWKQRMVDKVGKSEARRTRQRRRDKEYQFHVQATRPLLQAVRAAAKLRGISASGYIRRAVTKQTAKDLGVSWESLLKETPYPAAYGKKMAPPEKVRYSVEGSTDISDRLASPDDGTGYGDWSN